MLMVHFDGSPIPDLDVEPDEFEDIWEEIDEYGKRSSNFTNEKSYIMIERRDSDDFLANIGIDGWYNFPRIIMTPIDQDKWGVVINDEPERVLGSSELRELVRAFFEGKVELISRSE
ncbi:MAG: hypothetical protein ACTSXU_09670 [Promethearchaeota archaeon]